LTCTLRARRGRIGGRKGGAIGREPPLRLARSQMCPATPFTNSIRFRTVSRLRSHPLRYQPKYANMTMVWTVTKCPPENAVVGPYGVGKSHPTRNRTTLASSAHLHLWLRSPSPLRSSRSHRDEVQRNDCPND
jgi:hypothetical protein